MLDGLALPLICAAKPTSFAKCFVCLREIIYHPLLLEEEKYLGLWLALQSTNNESFICSYNYEQISLSMKLSTRKVHRILTRLRTMGVLIADIPIYYGVPTPEMVQKIRTFKLILPPRFVFKPKDVNGLVLPFAEHAAYPRKNINLIKGYKPKRDKKEENFKQSMMLMFFNFIAKYINLKRSKNDYTIKFSNSRRNCRRLLFWHHQ